MGYIPKTQSGIWLISSFRCALRESNVLSFTSTHALCELIRPKRRTKRLANSVGRKNTATRIQTAESCQWYFAVWGS